MQKAGYTQYEPQTEAQNNLAKGWDRVASLSMLELISLLLRQIPIMVLVFVVLFAIGMFGVLGLKKEYTSHGRILVQYGEEYIYNPVLGTAGQGTAYSTDQMIQAEVGFFTAVALKERVLEKIGLQRLFPELAAKYEANPSAKDTIYGKAIEEMRKNLGAFTAPNQPLISISYRDKDPEISAEVLNAIINEYLIYRREVLLDAGNSQYGKERKTTEIKLTEVNQKLALFLNGNQIGDFDAERKAAGVRYASLNDQLLLAKARAREIDAGIRAREDRLASIPAEILQYTDDNSSGTLAALEIERSQLLARYKPGSKPVQAIDARIQKLKIYIASGGGKNQGVTRTGINLVHQNLQSAKLTLEAEAQSNAERISVLRAQIAQVRTKQSKMQGLFPEYQRLASKADVLQAAVVQFSTREEEYQARRNLAEQASNNIRVIERPIVPFKGSSMKKPAAILAFLFAGFSALMVGLALVFSKIAKAAMRRNTPHKPFMDYGRAPLPPNGGGRGGRSFHGAPPSGYGYAPANMAYPAGHAPAHGNFAQVGPHGGPMAANQSPPGAVNGLPILASIGPKATRGYQGRH